MRPAAKVAGLFAGIGGFELGMHRAGHQTALVCDILPTAKAVLHQVTPDWLDQSPAAQVAAVDQPAQPAEVQGLLPTPTPASIAAADSAGSEGGGLTRELGEALSFQRLRTQFFNGMRISAALFIGIAAIVVGKRLFVWAWRRYS